VDFKKLATSFLIVVLGGLISLTILSFRTKEDDSAALARIGSQNQKAPNIQYPTFDLAGRKIPPIDYLVVFPECTSCSDFRLKAAEFMESQPNKVFLVLTPDTRRIEKLLNRNRFFVYQFGKTSKYTDLVPGMYAK
jgi:hypothetical protein